MGISTYSRRPHRDRTLEPQTWRLFLFLTDQMAESVTAAIEPRLHAAEQLRIQSRQPGLSSGQRFDILRGLPLKIGPPASANAVLPPTCDPPLALDSPIFWDVRCYWAKTSWKGMNTKHTATARPSPGTPFG
jgi:hypothetical protein